MKKLQVILDNGHGKETPGKRSPFKVNGEIFYEWLFNRQIVNGIFSKLKGYPGIDCVKLHDLETDLPLNMRCIKANSLANMACNTHNSFLLSVHANAGQGTGWEVYSSLGFTASDKIALEFLNKAKVLEPLGFKLRGAKEENFFILKNTSIPAVLTENLFMDTVKDVEFIASQIGKNTIIDLHVEAIKSIYANMDSIF